MAFRERLVDWETDELFSVEMPNVVRRLFPRQGETGHSGR